MSEADTVKTQWLQHRYCANVRSILEYGSVVWAGAACSQLERLESIQHKFLCFLAGRRRDRFNMSDYNGLCFSYKIDQLVKRRTALDLSFLYSVVSRKIDRSLLVGCSFRYVSQCMPLVTQKACMFHQTESWLPSVPFLLVCHVLIMPFCTLIRLLTYFMTLNRPCFIFITLSHNVSLGCVERAYLWLLCEWGPP